MTGTSKALARLGVAGLGAAVISVGMVPLTEIAANAAVVYPTTTATSVSLSPDSDTAAANACNPFTITVGGPSNRTVSVNIQQPVPASSAVGGTAAGADVIGFCQPLAANPDTGPTVPVLQGPGTPGTTTTAASPNTSSCTNTALAQNTAGNISCNTSYADTNNDGKIVIGVMSNYAGAMTVNAFGDANANGAQDSGEPGDTSAKTWVTNDKNAATDKLSCTPASATNPTNSQHNFTCTITDANGNGLAGADNVKFVVTSGPDASAVPTACPTTDNGTLGTTAGQTKCTLNNNGQPGHDVITVYLEQNNIVGQQAGEPSTTITKDWVQSASSGSTLSISCSPHQTSTTAAAGSPPNNAAATCQEDPGTKSVTITATATNGSPAQPQVGVVITFDQPVQTGGPVDASDTESTSPTTCVTNSSGTCTATFTDTAPVNNEQFAVVAHLTRQGQATANATATITYHTATQNEARNIAIAPATAKQPQGGSQDFVATVTDRFGNPVPGVCVGFNESGPGHFANTDTISCFQVLFGAPSGSYQTECVTSSAGTCTVTVVSQSTEAGDETVTATIDPFNYNGPNQIECQAPADRTYDLGGNSTTTPPGDPSTGAPAGNCSASGKVTWSSGVTPPPPTRRQAVNVKLACFSHHKHKVTCVAQLSKDISGVTVIFWDNHGNKVGSDITNKYGHARIHLRGLKSGVKHRYQAHAKRSSKTRSAWSRFATVFVK